MLRFIIYYMLFIRRVCTTKMHQIGKQRYGIAGLSMKYMRYKQLALDMFLNQRYVGSLIQHKIAI